MLSLNNTDIIYIDGRPYFAIMNLTQNNSDFLPSMDYGDYADTVPQGPPMGMFPPPPPDDAETIALKNIIWTLKMYYIPIIVIIGILGNIICVNVMLKTKLRLLSFIHYLAAILAADTLFLLNLLCLWLVDMGINLYQLGAWCHFTTFLSHSSGFLSLWYTVCLAVDRLIYVHCALLERKLCTTTRAKILIIALAFTAIAVFLNMSLLVEVYYMGPVAMCIPVRQYVLTVRKLTHIDTFVNAIIPYSTLIIICILVTIKTYRENRWLRTHGRNRHTRPTYECEHERGQTRAAYSFLLFFLLMTLPLQIIRVTLTLKEMVSPEARPAMKVMLWQQVLQYLYYSRYSLNLVVLLISYQGFRTSIKSIYVSLIQQCQNVMCSQSDQSDPTESDIAGAQVDEASVALYEIKDSD